MYGKATNVSWTSGYSGASQKLGKLLRVLSDDEDEMDLDARVGPLMTTPLGEPWLEDFHGYLNSTDQLGKLTIIQWWGVRDCFKFTIPKQFFDNFNMRSILSGTLSGLH